MAYVVVPGEPVYLGQAALRVQDQLCAQQHVLRAAVPGAPRLEQRLETQTDRERGLGLRAVWVTSHPSGVNKW